MKTFAYGSVPKDGGTFTLYKSLRRGLKSWGWDIRCVTVGAQEHTSWNRTFADEGCISIAPDESRFKGQACAFANWCAEFDVNVVMPVNSEAMLSAVPHLPKRVRIISRCADSIDLGYQKTLYSVGRVSRIVATTPRHVEDLRGTYGMPSNKIVLIPHGIDVKPFASLTGHNQCQDGVIDLAFLGRLEHNQKGVLYIPDILDRLDALQVPYRLRIAGSGSHRQAMESRMQQAVSEGRVSFVGTLPRRDIPAFLRQADVLLFPSHHEGFGFSLIEGMAAGCVPVASRLEGVTDFIIEDERTGILCPVGDVEAFASAIMTLYEDSARLHRMGKAAAEAAHRRFNSDRVAADYAQMLNAVVDENPVAPPPLPWSEFRVPPPYRRGWRDILPRPVRLIARRLLYKLNLSEKYG